MRGITIRKVILGQKAHDEAVAKIESWKRGENKYTDAELWNARNIIAPPDEADHQPDRQNVLLRPRQHPHPDRHASGPSHRAIGDAA